MKFRFALLVLVSWSIFGYSAENSDRGQKSSKDNGAAPSKKTFGDSCTAQSSKSGDGMMIACNDGRILFILPGMDWAVNKSPAERAIVAANSGRSNISVLLADPEETQYDVREHLAAIHRGIVKSLDTKKYRVGDAHFEKAPNGHVVLWYEFLTTPSDGLPQTRSIHAWTALRRIDRRFLDYHVSWISTVDDPEWKIALPKADPKRRMVNLADMFFVTDERGQVPPQ